MNKINLKMMLFKYFPPFFLRMILLFEFLTVVTSIVHFYVGFNGYGPMSHLHLLKIQSAIFHIAGVYSIPVIEIFKNQRVDGWFVSTSVAVLYSAAHFCFFGILIVMRPLNKKQERELADDLGLSSVHTKRATPFVFINNQDGYIDIENQNPNIVLGSIDLEKFEHVFRQKFKFSKASKIIINGSNFIRLYIRKEVKKYNLFENLPSDLTSLDVFIGKDINTGSNVILNLHDNSAIFISGPPNSGKTIHEISILEQFMRANPEHILIVATTKMLDMNFLRTIPRYKNRVVLLDMNKKESYKVLISYFKKMEILGEEIDNFVVSRNIPPEHLKVSKLIEHHGFKSDQLYFFLLDEIIDYLRIEKSDKSDDELFKLKSELVALVSRHIRKYGRYANSPIVLAGQIDKADAVDVDLQRTFRICSRTTSAMSQILMGDSKILTSPELTQGTFAIMLNDGVHLIKVPFFDYSIDPLNLASIKEGNTELKKKIEPKLSPETEDCFNNYFPVYEGFNQTLELIKNYLCEDDFVGFYNYLISQKGITQDSEKIRSLRPHLITRLSNKEKK